MSNQLQLSKGTSFIPTTIEDAQKIVGSICNSSLVPQSYRGKSGEALAAVIYGAELGLSPFQAMQSIAMINGKPSLYGDALLALVQSHPMYESIQESIENTDEGLTAVCTIKRKGSPAHTVKFSQKDAQLAGKWGTRGPWTQYPKRMLQMRARGFACRDQFADILKGVIIKEEAQDYEVIDVTPEKKPHENIIDVTPETDNDVLFEEYKAMIISCESKESLNELGEDIKSLPDTTKAELKSIYVDKLKTFN